MAMDWLLSPAGIGTIVVISVTVILYLLLAEPRVVLDKDRFKPLTLIEKDSITHNTKRFRFALPGRARLGLPVGQHISFKFTGENGNDVLRSYTPVTADEQRGYVEFVIKIYPEGRMSQHVDKLKINDKILMRGPKGKFSYTQNMKKSIGMIAGGTGITPMYQIAREIIRKAEDTTKIMLIFANVSIDDILLKEEVDSLARQHPEQFVVHYVLDHAPKDWTGGEGYITPDMITKHCPTPDSDCLILSCGPPPMVKATEAHVNQLGYTKEQYFTF